MLTIRKWLAEIMLACAAKIMWPGDYYVVDYETSLDYHFIDPTEFTQDNPPRETNTITLKRVDRALLRQEAANLRG